jgi:lambda family phage portal protein
MMSAAKAGLTVLDWFQTIFRKQQPIATRAYDAAAGGRRWRDSGATPSLQSTILAGREPTARRARDASINQPLAVSAVEVWTGEAIGSGMRPVPQTGGDALDATISAAFEAWTDRADFLGTCSFYGLQAQAASRAFIDGEWFCLLVMDGDEMRLKALDPAQIDSALSQQLPTGGAIIAGIEIDARGKPVAVHVFKNWLPGLPLLKGLELIRIDVADVLHLFTVATAGQARGISKLAAVLLRLRELDSLVDGQLVRQKVGALLAGFIVDSDGTLLTDGATPGEVSLEPGTMTRLKPGESVSFSDPPQIGAESNAFQKAIEREIGAGCGVPSFMLTHDLSEVNFSSARTALVAFRRRIEAWQDHFAFQVLRPVYRRFLTVEVLSGRLAAPLNETTLRHKWIAPKSQWLDPLKDAQAEALAIGAGLTSRRESVASRGLNIEELDAEIAADRAREKALGISFAPVAAPQPTGQTDGTQ